MSAWAFCLLRNQKVGFELVSPGQCRIAPGDDHGGGAGPASAPRSALGGPRGAHQAATPATDPDQHISPGADPVHCSTCLRCRLLLGSACTAGTGAS